MVLFGLPIKLTDSLSWSTKRSSGMKLPKLILTKLRKGPLISAQVVVRDFFNIEEMRNMSMAQELTTFEGSNAEIAS